MSPPRRAREQAHVVVASHRDVRVGVLVLDHHALTLTLIGAAVLALRDTPSGWSEPGAGVQLVHQAAVRSRSIVWHPKVLGPHGVRCPRSPSRPRASCGRVATSSSWAPTTVRPGDRAATRRTVRSSSTRPRTRPLCYATSWETPHRAPWRSSRRPRPRTARAVRSSSVAWLDRPGLRWRRTPARSVAPADLSRVVCSAVRFGLARTAGRPRGPRRLGDLTQNRSVSGTRPAPPHEADHQRLEQHDHQGADHPRERRRRGSLRLTELNEQTQDQEAHETEPGGQRQGGPAVIPRWASPPADRQSGDGADPHQHEAGHPREAQHAPTHEKGRQKADERADQLGRQGQHREPERERLPLVATRAVRCRGHAHILSRPRVGPPQARNHRSADHGSIGDDHPRRKRSVGRGSGESPPDTDYCRGAGGVRSAAPTCHYTGTRGVARVALCRIPELGGSPVADTHNSRPLSAC